jgi:hypothetical protein
MTLPTRFGLLNSEFNGFLYAPIGVETNDVQLSVLSGLTRLGIDPWAEAARLAVLPKAPASRALATTIARLGSWNAAEVESIANHLVELLPRGIVFAKKGRAGSSGPKRRSRTIFWVIGAAATAALLWLARILSRLWIR